MASSTTLEGPLDDNIVPLLYLTVFLCVAMSVMLFVEKVYRAIVKLFKKRSGRHIFVKLFKKRPGRHPERQYIHEKDEIVVQIPVFNEKEVHLSLSSSGLTVLSTIGAACRVSWRSDRIIIQVIDDSTDPVIKERNKEKEVMEDENERNQEEEIRTTEEKEDENERNQEEEIRRTTKEKEDENESNQEEEIRRTTKEEEDENKRNQEEEIRTTEEQKRRKVNQDDEGRKKRKQQCRWVRSCMAMGCAAIFTTALIYLCAANIPEEETIYFVPT